MSAWQGSSQYEGDCGATWPREAAGDQVRLWCTLDARHVGPHEAWTMTGAEPYKTWAGDLVREAGQ